MTSNLYFFYGNPFRMPNSNISIIYLIYNSFFLFTSYHVFPSIENMTDICYTHNQMKICYPWQLLHPDNSYILSTLTSWQLLHPGNSYILTTLTLTFYYLTDLYSVFSYFNFLSLLKIDFFSPLRFWVFFSFLFFLFSFFHLQYCYSITYFILHNINICLVRIWFRGRSFQSHSKS